MTREVSNHLISSLIAKRHV
jgi:staphylococcal nuclease domain-containing protein 1